MTTETILTNYQIHSILHDNFLPFSTQTEGFARAIEQAVLQSPEVQAWKRDALRFQKIMCMTRAEREEVLFFADDRDVLNAINATMEQQK